MPVAAATTNPRTPTGAGTTRARAASRPVALLAILVLGVLTVTLTTTAGTGAASAATRHPARPLLHVTLGRATLPGAGAPLTVRFTARRSTRCRVTAPARIRVPKAWHGCRTGSVRVVAHVPANTASVPRRSHVTVWAYGPGGRVGVVAFFVQAPASAHATPTPSAASGPSPGTPVPSGATSSTASTGTPQPGVLTPLVVTTVTLPTASVGQPYTATLSATGGTAPYRWTAVDGALPAGIALDPSGSLSGVPPSAATATVTVAVADAATPAATARASLTLTVVNAPYHGQASANWSGYVASSGGPLVTETSGQWTVPQLDCTRTPNGGLATWVGIGGARTAGGGTSGVLLQTGVSTDCVAGAQNDLAWWEEYPSKPNSEVAFSGLTVSPGDVVRASVYEANGGAWVTRLDDLTAGESGVMVTGESWGVSLDGSGSFSNQGSTATLTYAGGTTAEWVAEDYQRSGTLVPLAAYGTLTFSQLTTSLSPWSLTAVDAVEMVQNGSVISIPSPPGTDGFAVRYTGP